MPRPTMARAAMLFLSFYQTHQPNQEKKLDTHALPEAPQPQAAFAVLHFALLHHSQSLSLPLVLLLHLLIAPTVVRVTW